jgi:hypothetical protein
LRQRHPGPRGEQRLVLLLGRVARDVVLAARGFRLGSASVEVGLREELPIQKHPRTLEVGLRQVVGRFGVGHFRHAIDLESSPIRQSQPCLDLSGVCLRFLGLGADLDICDSNELAAVAHAAPALDRRGHHASGDFGGHFSLFLGSQRAGDGHESRNRTLDRHRGGNGDRGDLLGGGFRVGRGVDAGVRAATGGEYCQREQP